MAKQKGMTRRNHHDHLSNSGQQSFGSSRQTRKPKTTTQWLGSMFSLSSPKPAKGAKPRLGNSSGNGKKPYKSF